MKLEEMISIIPLTHGKAAIIDARDFDLISTWKWRAFQNKKGSSANWYARGSKKINGKHKDIFMHRLIMNAPKDILIDHINRDSLDNRRENLRGLPSANANNWNSTPRKREKTKYVGINPTRKRWAVHFSGKYYGRSKDEHLAALKFDQLVIQQRDEHAHTNFPRPLVKYISILESIAEAANKLNLDMDTPAEQRLEMALKKLEEEL